MEHVPLLDSPKFVAYSRRWYILMVFSLVVVIQNIMGNTWGPIAQSAKLVYDWNDGIISMMSNWSCIAYVVVAIPFAFLLKVKGLRWCVVLSALMILVAAGLRFVPIYPTGFNYASAIINGIPGPVLMAAPPMLSAVWFLPNERATATGISSMAGNAGLLVSFILGPMLVSEPSAFSFLNGTYVNGSSTLSNWTNVVPANSSDPMNMQGMLDDIRIYVIILATGALFFALLALIYFPRQPPTAPSASATVERLGFLESYKLSLRNGNFWIIALAYSIPSGSFSAFVPIFVDVITNAHIGIDQRAANWLAFVAQAAGVAAGVLIGKRMKMTLIVAFVVSTLSLAWLAVIATKIIPMVYWQLYTSLIIASMGINAVTPPTFEVAVEITFPIPESVVTMLMTQLNNLICIFFLIVPNIGTIWTTWTAVGASLISVPMMLLFREHYRRMEVDDATASTDDGPAGPEDPDPSFREHDRRVEVEETKASINDDLADPSA